METKTFISNKSPCQNCEDRRQLCHSVCRLYLFFQEQQCNIKAKQSAERDVTDYVVVQIRKQSKMMKGKS